MPRPFIIGLSTEQLATCSPLSSFLPLASLPSARCSPPPHILPPSSHLQLTPIIIGIFDRDVDREKGLQYPALYKQGNREEGRSGGGGERAAVSRSVQAR